jgi:hypothetical protein
LLLSGSLFFGPEDGGRMFLRNAGVTSQQKDDNGATRNFIAR